MKTPLWLWLLIAFSLSWPAGAVLAATAVGEVTFLIGQAQRIDSRGKSEQLDIGSRVYQGDRIETGIGGHVHMRFIDQAFVSVRPKSRLIIERYSYNSRHPERSAVRFSLEQGVVRSITGEAGSLQPERYRLNTPLAAIGVRGTDFVTSAQPRATSVLLNRGAVLVSTLGAACAANGLGPCRTDRAALLSDANKGYVAQLRASQSVPRLVALDPQQIIKMFGAGQREPAVPNGAEPGARRDDEAARGLGWDDLDASRSYLSQDARSRSNGVRQDLAPTAVGAATAAAPPPAELAAPAAPVAPVAPVDPAQRRGEAAGIGDVELPPGALPETMSRSYEEASADRRITAGNFDYGLFRAETEGEPRALPGSLQGQANFSLREGTAHLVQGSVISDARIDGGRLDIDFTARRYATDLRLSHPAAGSHTLHSAGTMNDEGIFAERSAQQWIGGAVSRDGQSAGYFFEKPVPAGTFKGLTTWGR